MTIRSLLFAALTAVSSLAADVTVRLSVAPGLKYDPARFVVAPGDQVTVVLHNGDDMIHNFVLVQPGERLKIVQAALTLGADGPAKNFVPSLPEVLQSTRALNPGETATLNFRAPEAEGVYPYVCTFPGHGFVMFGAMYVSRAGAASLPPLSADHNVPPEIASAANDKPGGPGKWLLKVGDRPVVCRTYLPDTGPASIAVGLPGGQNYVFDPTTCTVRYVWKGGFVDNTDQWEGKGDLWSKVAGRIYFRGARTTPLRVEAAPPPLAAPADAAAASYPSGKGAEGVGDAASPAGKTSGGDAASTRWLGYKLIDGYPEFHYTLTGTDVRELIRPTPTGLQLTFSLSGAPSPLRYVTDLSGGASFTSSAGEWDDGTLRLTAAQSRNFTITLTERPKVEPLGYWSMDDVLWTSARVDPQPGVVGRAFTPGGFDRKTKVLDTGIATNQLPKAATFMAWVKQEPHSPTAAVFALRSGWVITAPYADGKWHHLAIVFADAKTVGDLWVDGQNLGPTTKKLPAGDERFAIGSDQDHYLAGLIDEVRIFDRALAAEEIHRIYEREAKIGGLLP